MPRHEPLSSGNMENFGKEPYKINYNVLAR